MRQTLLSRWEGALLGSTLPVIKSVSASETVQSWHKTQGEGMRALAETGEWSPHFEVSQDPASEILVQSLPLLLFFNDQPQRLAQQLRQIALQGNNTRTTDAMVAYAFAISWGTTETLVGNHLFQQLKVTIHNEESYKVLETLQGSLEQGETLQEIQVKLPLTCQDIWLALYCFATTSEDLTLGVRRVNKSKGSNPAILALVGEIGRAHV